VCQRAESGEALWVGRNLLAEKKRILDAVICRDVTRAFLVRYADEVAELKITGVHAE